MQVENIGEDQYQLFTEERLRSSVKHLMDPIKQNKVQLFTAASRVKSKVQGKMSGLKSDRNLFSKLYIATSEHRSGDLETFFQHENQQYPPSISVNGELRSCTKSDLVNVLIQSSENSTSTRAPNVQAKIFDGPAVVHMLNPGQSKTFQDYIERVFLMYAKQELSSVLRIDFVWDVYITDSLKNLVQFPA